MLRNVACSREKRGFINSRRERGRDILEGGALAGVGTLQLCIQILYSRLMSEQSSVNDKSRGDRASGSNITDLIELLSTDLLNAV